LVQQISENPTRTWAAAREITGTSFLGEWTGEATKGGDHAETNGSGESRLGGQVAG